LFAGLSIPILYSGTIHGQAPLLAYAVLVFFAAAIMYGVTRFGLADAMIFGVGLLTMSFAASNIWLGFVAVAASSASIVKYAISDANEADLGYGAGEDPLPTQHELDG
jgi:hypothetical protein